MVCIVATVQVVTIHWCCGTLVLIGNDVAALVMRYTDVIVLLDPDTDVAMHWHCSSCDTLALL